jgi:hypothetical protein
MHWHHTLFLLFSTLALLGAVTFAMPDVYRCGSPCPATFNTKNHLVRHRKSERCAWNAAQATASRDAIADADAHQDKRPRTDVAGPVASSSRLSDLPPVS